MERAFFVLPIWSYAMPTMPQDYNDHDLMFVREMIMHHTRAIEMTIGEWGMGKNQEVKDMAMKMYTAQSEEIKSLRKWLDDRGVSEVYGSEEMIME